VVELKNGEISEYHITPQDMTLPLEDLRGLEVADAEASLALIRSALTGAGDDRSRKAASMIALNAGAAIYVAGLCDSVAAGVERAQKVIANGSAWQRLEQLASLSSSF